MKEQTNTNIRPLQSVADTIWINIWRNRDTGAERRGIYNFTSPGAAASAAREWIEAMPRILDHVGVMPLDEWIENKL